MVVRTRTACIRFRGMDVMHGASEAVLGPFCAVGPGFYPDPGHPAAPSEARTRALLSRAITTLSDCTVELFCIEGRARASAIVNPALRDTEGHPIGLVGLFECEDDSALARTILDAACAWLRDHGCRHARGPMSFSTFHPSRFVTDGEPSTWLPGDPLHPPYYPALWEACGFTEVATYTSNWIDPLVHFERFRPRAEACLNSGFVLRRPTPEDGLVFHALTMKSFASAFMFAPIDAAEHAALYPASLLVGDMARHSALVFDPEGNPAGYLWATTRRVGERDAVAAKTIAVAPEYRGHDVYHVLIADMLGNALAHGLQHVVAAVMHVEGSPSRMGWIRDDTRVRRYALYDRALV